MPKVPRQMSRSVEVQVLAVRPRSYCLLAAAPKSPLCACLSSCAFSEGTRVARTQPCTEHLHHGHGQALEIKGFSLVLLCYFALFGGVR